MARYKPYDVKQVTLIPVSFPDQILPGSFEYALNEIVDEHIDLRSFEARYQNDETGCLAYDPAILLKIVLFGYYKGLISSRRPRRQGKAQSHGRTGQQETGDVQMQDRKDQEFSQI